MTAATAEAQPQLVLSAEHEDFRQSLRGFCERHAKEPVVRAALDGGGYNRELWTRMADELGLQGMTVPEACDGAGYGPIDAIPVFEELGRSLAPVPYFETVALAVNALVAAGDDAATSKHLRAIAAGETTATLAWTGPDGRTIAVTADEVDAAGDGAPTHVLRGRAMFVPGGATADLIVVAAHLGDDVALFAVDGAAVERAELRSLDPLRPLADLRFDATPGELLGVGALETALDHARTALAAEMIGGAERLLELTVAYAKDRVQFGRPIGSYQAIKHRCADMLSAIESARALAYYAAWAAAEAPRQLPAAAAAAKAACSDAYAYVAEETIQVHGGIAFTWEHPAHLYFKRAHSSRVLLGTPAEQRRRFADAA